MIDSLIGAFKIALTKPAVWVPALIAGVINYAIFLLLFGFIGDFILYALFIGTLPATGVSVAGFPFEFYAMYSSGINAIIALLAAVFVTNVFMQFFYGDYVRQLIDGRPSFSTAFSYATSNLGKIVSLFVFFFVIVLLAAILMWLAILFSLGTGFLGDIVFAIVVLLFFYIYIKLLFTVPAMAVDRLPIKEGLKRSWNFSQKFLPGIIVLIVVGWSITYLITSVGLDIADAFGIDLVFLVVFVILSLFNTAFFNLLLPFYYMRKEHGKTFA